jgi:prepilin-type N-terminal cleavage/methylation domain-containing protein
MHADMPLYQSKTVSSQSKKMSTQVRLGRGFTLVELLVVISIIGILASIVFSAIGSAKKKAYTSRAKEEFHTISTALELYLNDNGGNYPPDVSRSLPPGLEKYLGPGTWPAAPWPGSVYDWDNWAPTDLTYAPQSRVYQISIRFCPEGQPTQCKFPDEPWATSFDYYSSVYFCLSGPCRAHSSQPVNHPAYCINC